MVLRTVPTEQPTRAAIWDGRWPSALARRIWARRSVNASRLRSPAWSASPLGVGEFSNEQGWFHDPLFGPTADYDKKPNETPLVAAGGPLKRIAALCLIGALVAPCAVSDPDSDRVGRQAPRRPSVSSPDLPPLPPPAANRCKLATGSSGSSSSRTWHSPTGSSARAAPVGRGSVRAEGHWPKPDREPLKRLEFP